METEPLSLTMAGELAQAVRSAAEREGLRPSEWVVRTISARLTHDDQGDREPPPNTGRADPWEDVTDPSGTFTVTLPRGWQHDLAVVPAGSSAVSVFSATSPDQSTTMSSGDPEVTAFAEPGPMAVFAGAPIRPATPADQFAAEYLQHRYGQRESFVILGARPSPELIARAQERARQEGFPMQWVTAAQMTAQYIEAGRRVGVVALITTSGGQGIWMAEVAQVVSTDDPTLFVPDLLRAISSARLTPQGQQRIAAERNMRQAQHDANMRQIDMNTITMNQRHQQNMANLHNQATAHQQRMGQMQATWDAQNASWASRQAGVDASHAAYMGGIRQETPHGGPGGADQQRDFVNMIREERTVVDADGYDRQVEAGFDKYYHRQHDDSWIGLEQHQDIHDVPGINPDDYYETPFRS